MYGRYFFPIFVVLRTVPREVGVCAIEVLIVGFPKVNLSADGGIEQPHSQSATSDVRGSRRCLDGNALATYRLA